MSIQRLIGSIVVLALATASVAAPRSVQDVGRRAAATQPPGIPTSGLVLERLGPVSIDVDGQPKAAVGWRIEASPEFLATIPRELLARDADPASGTMMLVLRVTPEHPAVARIETMLHEMFGAWTRDSSMQKSQPPPGPIVLVLPEDRCIVVCEFYSCDGAGDLYRFSDNIDSARLIGNMGVTMFDIAVSTDRHLYGISGGQLYLIDTCTAQVTPVGPSSLGNGLGADLATTGLFAQGPPLVRIPLPQTLPETVGGACCGAPPSWCGSSADITESDLDDRLYSYLRCAGCAGDTLVAIDAATGAVTDEIGCLRDILGLAPNSDVTGLVYRTCSHSLLVGFVDSDFVISAAAELGWGTSDHIPGTYAGTFGFATVPVRPDPPQPPTCNPAADPPACWSVQLHANATDPDGDPLTHAWTTTCAGALFAPSAAAADPLVTLDAGCRTCTFEDAVNDGNGGTCDGSVDVAFEGAAPVVEASTLVSCLWPPNHGFVDVGLSATVTGGCADAGDVAWSVTSVTSDEATVGEPGAGGPRRGPDAIVDGLSVSLRAERSGLGDGRVYRITVTAMDACGNTGEAVVEVGVPHDHATRAPGRRRGPGHDEPCPAVDSGARHDATQRN